MGAEYLLDASALIALIRNEPGTDRVKALLDDCQIHSVNLTEVVRKLISKGMPPEEVRALLEALNLPVIESFSREQSYAAGQLAAGKSPRGLSLGDSVCLTAAESAGMTAVTADRRWSELAHVKLLLLR